MDGLKGCKETPGEAKMVEKCGFTLNEVAGAVIQMSSGKGKLGEKTKNRRLNR